MADYTLSARGTYDGRDFDSGVEASGRKLDDFQGRCAATQVAIGNLLSGAVSRIGSAIASSVDAAIGRVDTMNNFANVMGNLGVSSEAANQSIKTLSGDALKGLPTSLDAAVAGVQRLTSKNGDVQKSTDYFLAMNNAVIAGTNDVGMQQTAIEQLSQAYAKGKMDMQEWRAIQQAMPAQLSQVAKALGTTSDELGEGLRGGSASMEQFMQTLVKLNEEGVDGLGTLEEQARASTGGIATQVANLQTAVTRSVASVIDKFNETGAITKTIKMVTDAVNVAGSTVMPIAAEVGEKVSELADVAGEALEPLAESMSEDGEAFAQVLGGLVSGVTSLVSAVSPLLPTIAKVAPLMLAAHAASTALAGGLTNLSSKVIPTLFQAGMNGSKAADAMLSGMSSLSAFAGGPMVAAITAAVAVIGVLVTTFVDAQRRQEEFEKATTGLAESSRNLGESSKEAADGIASVGSAAETSKPSVDGYAQSVDELVRRQAELADSMGEAFNEVSADNDVLHKYSDAISELAGNCDGSEEKIAELKAAVKSYNDIAGTSYEVTDALNGSLNVSTSALRENTEAFKRRNDAAVAQEQLVKVQERMAENEAALAKAEKEADAAARAYGDTTGMTAEMQQLAADSARNAAYEVSRLKALIEQDEAAIGNLADTIRAGGADALDSVASSASSAGDALGDAAESAEDAAKALESSLDAQYEAQQRAYDAQHKEQQRAYDADYKARQKAYDADYKALQKALGAEEDALSKSHSRQYDALRDRLDKEYAARKDGLDARYDALKKSLDKELDELRKANDKELNELKKSQSAQVSEYQKATKQRIAEIDKEYAAKLRLIEADEKKRTDSIDSQIDAIESQSKSEEKERKRAEQEQRKSELQKAVNTARYASERAAAEKELADYLAEVEQERVEEERAALVASLNQQKAAIEEEVAAKKKALQEDRDARKDAAQESGDAQLEAMRAANDAQYEAMKEALEAEEAAMGESHERRLERAKKSYDKKLEKLKKSQQDQLDALKESQQAQEDALGESHASRLEAVKDSQSDQLDAMKQSQQDQLDAMKQSQQDQLKALKQSQQDQLDAFKKGRASGDEEGKGAADDAKRNAEQAAKNMEDALKASHDPIGDACAKIREKIQEKVKPTEGDMEGFGSSGGRKFADAMAGEAGEAADAAGDLVGSAGGKFESADATKAGENFASTFANGMGGVDVWSAAYRIGASALDAIKDALGIHSPSREAMKLFKQFDRGAMAGIDDDSDLVAKSAASMARSALDAVGRMPSPTFGTIGFTGSVSAAPNGALRSGAGGEPGGDTPRGGLTMYIGELTVRNRSDADYFSEVLYDKWAREGAGAL